MIQRLDDPETYATADPRGLCALLREFPEQLADAARMAQDVRVEGARPAAVLILGMGGSAVAGDMLQALCQDRAPFPVQVYRGYSVPAWVGPDTLAIASSYSGRTEETCAAFDAARRRGARGLVVSSGGDLGARAQREGLPWLRVPPGFPPRAALAYLLLPVMIVLDALGADLGGVAEGEEAFSALETLGAGLAPEVPVRENLAKDLAAWLLGRRPVIYGTDATAPVAYRWRTQIEENAKVLAHSGILPEINHNTIEAWPRDPHEDWAVVFLRDAGEHPRVARRAELTRSITDARVPTREVWARGDGRLARMLSLTLVGDWASYYLALLRGVDPSAIDMLEEFKLRMTREAGPVG